MRFWRRKPKTVTPKRKPTDMFHGADKEAWEWVKASGIAKDGDHVRRVVIDIEVGQIAKVYVEKMASRQMLWVKPIDLGGASITVVDKPEESTEVA